MVDFLNVKDLPVKDTFEDGDNVLVLSGGKLYRCPEGGGGGGESSSYVAHMKWYAEYSAENGDDESGWEFNGIASIADEEFEGFLSAINSGANILSDIVVVEDSTGEEIDTLKINGAAFIQLPDDFLETELEADGKSAHMAYRGLVYVESQEAELPKNGFYVIQESLVDEIK